MPEGHEAARRQTEIELKLGIDPLELAKLDQLELWRRLSAAPSRQLVSVYYDTPDGALRAHGYMLRVRSMPEGYEQTLKQATTGEGLLSRGEWSCSQTVDAPDLSLLGELPLPGHLSGLSSDELVPVCQVDVDRKSTLLRLDDGDRVEIVLDIGQAMSDDKIVPVAEVELELKEGSEAALFDVAARLNDMAPMRLLTHSKAEHVLAPEDGNDAAWSKAASLDLSAELTVDEVLDRIFARALQHLMANERAARYRLHIEGVHQMRVAVRRLRSALRLFQALLPEVPRVQLDLELKWLADSLGPARDMDVFRDELLGPAAPAVGSEAVFRDIERRVARLQDAAYDRVAGTLGSGRYTGLILELLRWRVSKVWRQQSLDATSARLFAPIGGIAPALLTQQHRRTRKRGKGFANLTLDERHRTRIAVKKLRYTVEFFADLYKAAGNDVYLKRLTDLQDDLGHLNDVATAERLLQDIVGPNPPARTAMAAGCILGWYRRGVHDEDHKLVRDWRRFAKARPFW